MIQIYGWGMLGMIPDGGLGYYVSADDHRRVVAEIEAANLRAKADERHLVAVRSMLVADDAAGRLAISAKMEKS